MRNTLRRSCNSCAKSKLSCDLRTPQCSRCMKKKSACVYANQPLTSPHGTGVPSPTTPLGGDGTALQHATNPITPIRNLGIQSFDPFDSYPQTRLPRAFVQRLIQHFLSNIAFQYYPLDLEATSNPFVVSWWPLALAEPALFHVSLQTASWDLEMREQKGFTNSEILMADSVSLVRQRIEDPVLASQDETMDSVVTLAAIEFGKGNTSVGEMHIDGVKRMVQMRGGMRQVKLSSPLTARMVSWVSMIVKQSPQFPTQNDSGNGDGIAPISIWHEAGISSQEPIHPSMEELQLESAVGDVLFRLRSLFHETYRFDLSTTNLHDLTLYVLHRLLAPPDTPQEPSISECIRHAIALYMLIIHGPTYFPHLHLQYNSAVQLKTHLEALLPSLLPRHRSLALWLVSLGMVASDGSPECHWFTAKAGLVAETIGLCTWEDVFPSLQEILWLVAQPAEYLFRERWEKVWTAMAR